VYDFNNNNNNNNVYILALESTTGLAQEARVTDPETMLEIGQCRCEHTQVRLWPLAATTDVAATIQTSAPVDQN